MPAQWTGVVVGKIHNNQLTAKELAKEIGWNEKYLSQVLNSENPPKDAEKKVNDALNRIIERKRKALASTTLFDGMYYELTYNGDKKELYFDAYKKWENKTIPVGR